MSSHKLFQPIQVGRLSLSHRIILSPLTRMRVDDETRAPLLPVVKEHYAQRAQTPGTLLIAEGTMVAAKAGGYPNIPEIWSAAQIAAWKEVVDAVHAQGSYIILQLAGLGRTAMPVFLAGRDPSFEVVGPSAIAKDAESVVPRELSVDEIEEYVELFGVAAENAVLKAGFDGVEIHGANGYLIDQFLQSNSNQRTDAYGGSPEKRTKFALDIAERISRAIGEDRVGMRVSPWAKGHGLGMKDPKPTYSHLVRELKRRFPSFAYFHAIEPRVDEHHFDKEPGADQSNDFIREIWAPKPFIAAGGYTRENAIVAAEKGDLIAFGRWYLANPDLPRRLKEDIPLNQYDRSTFYLAGDASGKGYTDYPFAQEN